MIGKVILTVDERPHCCNGWGPTKRHPACNYTGGHYCCRLADHKGPCKCSCGSTTARRPDREEEPRR